MDTRPVGQVSGTVQWKKNCTIKKEDLKVFSVEACIYFWIDSGHRLMGSWKM